MRRRVPADPVFSVSTAPRAALADLEVHVVTPMFGGGVDARTVNAERPVTAQTVRGQLRFWWRACHAAEYATASELFKAESAIWGSVSGDGLPGPSRVEVEVHTKPIQPQNCAQYNRHRDGVRLQLQWLIEAQPRDRGGALPYALYPFQGEVNTQVNPHVVKLQPATYANDFQFNVALRPAPHVPAAEEPALREEVVRAVRAWVVFGGVGTRTRRGCGSLWVGNDDTFQPPAEARELVGWLDEAGIPLTMTHATLHPVLAGSKLVVHGRMAHLAAWNEAVRGIQLLRQGINVGRKPGPGRSLWPEPDTIREKVNIVDIDHPPEHLARPYFPRADLGLPILFQRLDGRVPWTLAPEDNGRMASPVITKALAVSQTEAVPLICVLNAPHVWDQRPGVPSLVLSKGRRTYTIPVNELQPPGGGGGTVAPLCTRTTNARDALLRRAETEWATTGETIT